MVRKAQPQITGGVLLVTVGAVLLATRFVSLDAAPLWLFGLGLAFALLAVVRRAYGLLVAGLVLLGVGSGMVLGDAGVAGLPKNAWMAFALGTGFVLIYLVDVLLGLRRHWWPLVPGAVLLAIGFARAVEIVQLIPPVVEIAVRQWWPAALIVIGLVLILRRSRA